MKTDLQHTLAKDYQTNLRRQAASANLAAEIRPHHFATFASTARSAWFRTWHHVRVSGQISGDAAAQGHRIGWS